MLPSVSLNCSNFGSPVGTYQQCASGVLSLPVVSVGGRKRRAVAITSGQSLSTAAILSCRSPIFPLGLKDADENCACSHPDICGPLVPAGIGTGWYPAAMRAAATAGVPL